MTKKKLTKDDISQMIEGARSMVGALSEQAAAGEVDANLLNQVGSALEMAVDYVEELEGPAEAAQAASGQGMPLDNGEMSKEAEAMPEEKPAPVEPSEEKEEVPPMSKSDQPLATRPPQAPDAYFKRAEDDMERNLAEFSAALEFGNLAKARQLAGGNQAAFEVMVTKACFKMMDAQDWRIGNIHQIRAGLSKADFTDHTDRRRNVFASNGLQKSITASDIPGVNLIRLARLMLPVYAGLRRRLPAQVPETGSNQATWRAQLGFGSLSFATGMRVAEAAVGQAMAESFLTFNAPYKDSAFNDSVTMKATFASRGYDDPLQVSTIVTLSSLLKQEEINILGQSAAAIAAPATVAGTQSTGGSLADGTYAVKVTSLTYEGWLGGANGGTDSGESTATASSNVTVTGGGGTASIAVTFPVAVGAVAYNVYLSPTGTGGTYAWCATVTKNAYTILAAGTGDAPPATDTSVNAYGYEGLLSWAERSTVYGNAIPNKVTPTDLAGGALTTASNAGIDQFDTVLESLWSTWQISPTMIVTSPKGGNNVTTKLLNTDNPLLYRVDMTQRQGEAQGGVMVTGYVNKFAPFGDGSARFIDIVPHPYCPDGTFLIICEAIPYAMSREARGFALETLVPYTYFPLYPTSTINYPYAVTLSETMLCFHPSVQTALQGVNVGQTA